MHQQRSHTPRPGPAAGVGVEAGDVGRGAAPSGRPADSRQIGQRGHGGAAVGATEAEPGRLQRGDERSALARQQLVPEHDRAPAGLRVQDPQGRRGGRGRAAGLCQLLQKDLHRNRAVSKIR